MRILSAEYIKYGFLRKVKYVIKPNLSRLKNRSSFFSDIHKFEEFI